MPLETVLPVIVFYLIPGCFMVMCCHAIVAFKSTCP